ncbi:hypothetical protein [Methylobacterium sp. WSM2598]|uniref:hypothetical protein n=1 Tax=Methylobacterium sp. WSM2598 TaxID=398261 RepID=UPI00039F2534|nr:hypothetical protein [Methylobacterium sp. WSM2598]
MSFRPFLAVTVLVALAAPAAAQPKPKAPPPPPKEAAPPPDASAGLLFPCRSEKEICYVGVPKDGKLTVLFTNDPKGAEISGRALAVAGEGPNAPDLATNDGKVVMMVGTYDPKAGLTKAEIVDVAGPLVAFAIKASLGGGDEQPAAPPPPAPKRR